MPPIPAGIKRNLFSKRMGRHMDQSQPEKIQGKKSSDSRRFGVTVWSWFLPVVGGLLLALTVFWGFLNGVNALSSGVAWLATIIWLAGIVCVVACFIQGKPKQGLTGVVAVRLAPIIPYLLILLVSSDDRSKLAEGSRGLIDEIAAVFDSGSGTLTIDSSMEAV